MVVESVNHLKQLASNKNGNIQEVYIVLAVRLVRSSKRNLYDEELDEFSIVNEIDENYHELLTSEIRDKMNLKSAIEDEALYLYPVESSI